MKPLIKMIADIQPLNETEKDAFLGKLTAKTYKKNDFFVTAGGRSHQLAYMVTGYMRTYHLNDKGEEITSEFSSPNTFTGSYYSFYTQQPSFEFIQTITDCEVLLLSYETLQELYKTSFAVNVLGRKMLERSCIRRELRLKKMITLPASDRYEWFREEFAEINQIAQLQHIASFLGIKPETLSRIRRKSIS
jgi:CRP-like cAMP-binding protein